MSSYETIDQAIYKSQTATLNKHPINVTISAQALCELYNDSPWNATDYYFIERLTSECIYLTKAQVTTHSGRRSFQTEWCNSAAKHCFGNLFYQLWRHSVLNQIINFYDHYVFPVIILWSALTFLISYKSLQRFNRAPFSINVMTSSRQNSSGYGHLLSWTMLSLFISEVAARLPQYLTTLNWAVRLNSTSVSCPLTTFMWHVLENTPQWLLLLFCVDRCIAHMNRRHLYCGHCLCWPRPSITRSAFLDIFPVSPLGAKLTASFLIVLLMIMNVHALWMTTINPQGECKPSTLLEVGIFYQIFLNIVHFIIPSIIGSVCITMLLLSKLSSMNASYHAATTDNNPRYLFTQTNDTTNHGEDSHYALTMCLSGYLPFSLLPHSIMWLHTELWSNIHITGGGSGGGGSNLRPQPAPFSHVHAIFLQEFLVNRIYSEAIARVILVPLMCAVSYSLRQGIRENYFHLRLWFRAKLGLGRMTSDVALVPN